MDRMKWRYRLLEIFIQFGLIFYSIFIFYFSWSIIFSFWTYDLEKDFLLKWKHFRPKGGTTYHVEPSYRVEEDIFDNIKVVYDDGERSKMSGDQRLIVIMIFFLPIFRCISFLLSLIALIFPFVNVKVKNFIHSYANILFDVYWC